VIALLDVNLLVALFDPEHVHHDVAHDWFAEDCRGWASCPLTENGALRVLASPTRELRMPLVECASLLRRLCDHSAHHFWADDVSLLDSSVIDAAAIRGHKQLADVYLLALGVKHGGRFVTLDRGVPLTAVKGARPENLVVLAPSD
jgi:toxin-antitoxin system PIN domain toxin